MHQTCYDQHIYWVAVSFMYSAHAWIHHSKIHSPDVGLILAQRL